MRPIIKKAIKLYFERLWTKSEKYRRYAWYGWIIVLAELAEATGIKWESIAWLCPSDSRERYACRVVVREGLIYSIVKHELDLPEGILDSKYVQREWHCGYVRYFDCPMINRTVNKPADMPFEQWVAKDRNPALFSDYIPVHGGITFEQEDAAGYVYGFDTNHLRDKETPILQNHGWLMNEIHNMRLAIDFAVNEGFEAAYLTHESKKARATIIDNFHEALEEKGIIFNITENYGAMLNILCGKI